MCVRPTRTRLTHHTTEPRPPRSAQQSGALEVSGARTPGADQRRRQGPRQNVQQTEPPGEKGRYYLNLVFSESVQGLESLEKP